LNARSFCTLLSAAALLLGCIAVQAQQVSNIPAPGLPLAFRFTATEANSPPGSCGCFFLYGGAADIALPLSHSLSADVEIAGNHTRLVPGTLRGLSTITLLAGPRYRIALPRESSVFAQALFGAARGFDAEFRRDNNAVDTATAFGYALGAGYELRLTHTLTLRPAQVEYIQTNLPNGSDNRQRNIRLGAGIVVHISTASLQR